MTDIQQGMQSIRGKSGKQDKKRKDCGGVELTVVDAEKKQDENTENFPKAPVYDLHGPYSMLEGSDALWRRTGPETPEFQFIVNELVKPRNERDPKKLKALRKLALNQLNSKKLKSLVTLADNPRSLAYVIGQYDRGVRYLPSDLLPDLFELFKKGRGPSKSAARRNLDAYVDAHQQELLDRMKRSGPENVVLFLTRTLKCSVKIVRDGLKPLKQKFDSLASKKYSPRNPC